MRLSVVFLAAAIGSAMSIANAQTASIAGLAKNSTTITTTSGGGLLVGGSDDCSTPDPISGVGSWAYDQTAATTGTEGQSESLCYQFGQTTVHVDVWFDWTATFTGNVKVDTCGSSNDTKIAAYPTAGCPVGVGTALDCNDDSCGLQSVIQFPCVTGQVYALQVGCYSAFGGSTGMLNVSEVVPPPGCPIYHTGVSNNALGLTAGGDACYMYYVDCMTTIDTVEVCFGTAAYPGTCTNGLPATVAIWDDPTNDADPSDAVLVWSFSVPGGTVNACTDIFNSYPTGGIAATGGMFVGSVVAQPSGQFAASMDQTVPSSGLAWWVGNTSFAFDYNVLTNNNVGPSEMASIGFDTQWMLHCTGVVIGDEPGMQYCPGDGVYAPCPCANTNDGSMSGCDWQSLGGLAGADLTATGSNVVANADTYLTANNVEADFGVFFGANNQVAGTLNDGIRCAGGNLIRLIPPTNPGGSTATHAVPLQILDGAAAPGMTRNYQYWFRTPGGPCGTTANTSNGYSISWM